MSKDKVLEIINDSPSAFMATIDGQIPRVRPMMVKVVWDNKFYVSTFAKSRKVEQIKKNPDVEIVWMDKIMRHVRIQGKVSFCESEQLKKKYFDENKALQEYFKGASDPNYVLLEITPKKVEIMDGSEFDYKEVVW